MDQLSSKPRWGARQRRNPVWNRDEAILLLDVYLRVGRAPSEDLQVRRLSEDLRAIAQRRDETVTSTYRNAEGVAMKLKAMAQQDPAFRALGRKGLSRLLKKWLADLALT